MVAAMDTWTLDIFIGGIHTMKNGSMEKKMLDGCLKDFFFGFTPTWGDNPS